MFEFITGFFERRRLAKAKLVLAAIEAERVRREAEEARNKRMAEAGAAAIVGIFVGLLKNIVENPLPPFPTEEKK